MKKIGLIAASVVLVLGLVIGGFWISAFNKATKVNNELKADKIKIYVAYNARYEKVAAFVNAIESANEQITSQINLITSARQRFADALESNSLSELETEANLIESTFINLVVMMEDNPSAWNTVGLTNNFLAEFSGATNQVVFAVNSYNEKVAAFNTLIEIFPNNLFLKNFNAANDYETPTLQTNLPEF